MYTCTIQKLHKFCIVQNFVSFIYKRSVADNRNAKERISGHTYQQNWTHMPSASGSYGRLPDWQADEVWVKLETFKPGVRRPQAGACLVS